MRMILILLFGLLLFAACSNAHAQNQPQTTETKHSVASKKKRPKSEVKRMLEEAKERGEVILEVKCLHDCGKKSKNKEEDVEPGQALELPFPQIPSVVRLTHSEGGVKVKVIIDEEGNVIAAEAVSGNLLFFEVSVAAARRARFSPTKVKGQPVKVLGLITYRFLNR